MIYKYIAVLVLAVTVHGMVLPNQNCQPVIPYSSYAPCYSSPMNYAPGFQTQQIAAPVQPRMLPPSFNNRPVNTAFATKPAVVTQVQPQVAAPTFLPSAQYSMPSISKGYTLPTSLYGTSGVGQTFQLPNYMTGASLAAPVTTPAFGSYSTSSLMPTYGSSITPGFKTGFTSSFPSYVGGSSFMPQMSQFSTQPAMPSFGTAMPSYGTAMPSFGTSMSSFGTSMPSFGTSMPSFGTSMPSFGTTMPSFGTPSTFGTSNPFSSLGYSPYSTSGLSYSPTYSYNGFPKLNGLTGTRNDYSFK